MRVLYIGHYKEFGGWGRAATDQILALDKAGVDVVCRNITLTTDKKDLDPKLLQLESNQIRNTCAIRSTPESSINTERNHVKA